MSSKTFIILKPDALERGLVDQITGRFLKAGFKIEHIHYRVVDYRLIKEHYKEVILREGEGFKDWLKIAFVGKPTIPMILGHDSDDGITIARELIGHYRPDRAKPGTIRHDYGIPVLDQNMPSMNLIHASDSQDAYNKEKNLWFKATLY
ncbi:conserved protein of unknown function [Petrocella atlantisensis]|uniref:nucleoside-diphosphate kinase n=1 Tax=Petrocella atlantisensis TaxID=2173034 RepID=A0A3P7SB96_9FIRM|nr:nucleoside-diphosphate kinase [Petrocella atlantisensis]VDN49099.1 conserved protein of unknown function [Petrocella atlantisensis]